MKKFVNAAFAAFFLALLLLAPASATDRVQWPFGINPPSAWWNWMQRYNRLGFGEFLHEALTVTTSGFYANITVQTSSGLNVLVGPTSANQIGALYQYLPDDANSYGGAGTPLPADPNQVEIQGLMYANGPAIGPLTPPVTAGQSINFLIECQVSTIDQTSESRTFVSALGVPSTSSVNRDRSDTIACQSKAGSPATTGSQTTPSVDSGWVAVGFVAVANGTATITSGMITMLVNQSFTGFVQLIPTGGTAASQSGGIAVTGGIAGGTFLQGAFGTFTTAGGNTVALLPASGMTSGGQVDNAAHSQAIWQWDNSGNIKANSYGDGNGVQTSVSQPPVAGGLGIGTPGSACNCFPLEWGSSASTNIGALVVAGSSTASGVTDSLFGSLVRGGSTLIAFDITGNAGFAGGVFPAKTATVPASPGVFSGTGVPSFSAFNASMWMRSDGTTASTVLYINSCGSATSCNSWNAVTVP